MFLCGSSLYHPNLVIESIGHLDKEGMDKAIMYMLLITEHQHLALELARELKIEETQFQIPEDYKKTFKNFLFFADELEKKGL